MKRGTVRVNCLVQEHSIMYPARGCVYLKLFSSKWYCIMPEFALRWCKKCFSFSWNVSVVLSWHYHQWKCISIINGDRIFMLMLTGKSVQAWLLSRNTPMLLKILVPSFCLVASLYFHCMLHIWPTLWPFLLSTDWYSDSRRTAPLSSMCNYPTGLPASRKIQPNLCQVRVFCH